MSTKIKAGRYTVTNRQGAYTIKKLAEHKWIILNRNARMIGEAFTTLRAAEEWLSGLTFEPASNKSVSYLRRLLTNMAGDPFAERVRASLNERHANGEPLTQSLVSLAIDHLTHPWKRPANSLPVQSVVRDEAIQAARAAIKTHRN